MAYHFSASRITDGNSVFPEEIIIDDEEEVVIHRKPRLIGSKETRIRFGAIASVEVNKHILFADIIIETRGGHGITATGFTRDDARKIKDMLAI